MNRTITYVAAAAAVLVIAVVGYSLLRTDPSVGTQSPVPASPSARTSSPPSSGSPVPASPSPAPTSTAIAEVTIPVCKSAEGICPPLSGGRYSFKLTWKATVTVAASVPAGWNEWALPYSLGVTGPGDDVRVAVVFQVADGLYEDPCHWNLAGSGPLGQHGNVVVGPAAIDLVKALQDNSSYTTTTATAVVLGAHQGYELEIEFPDDVKLAECDGDDVMADSHYFEIFSGKGAFPYFFREGWRMRLFIVDVEDARVIATILYSDATSDAELEAARAIIDSVEFVP